MKISIIFLSLFVIGIGFIFANRIENLLFIEWNNLTNITSQTTHNLIVPILSLVSSLLGILVAYLFYKTDYFLKIEPSRNLLWKIVYNKFYFETVWSFIIKNLFYPISKGLNWFDKNIIDGAIRFLGYATIKTSQFVSLMQSGNIQAYISCAIFVIGLFLIALVWVYYWMMKV